MRFKVLSKEQIEEAKYLRKYQGFTKRKLADYFNVPQTTIWDNVFAHRRLKRNRPIRLVQRTPTFRELRYLILVITELKKQGHLSSGVAHSLQIPLAEVNYIYGRYH